MSKRKSPEQSSPATSRLNGTSKKKQKQKPKSTDDIDWDEHQTSGKFRGAFTVRAVAKPAAGAKSRAKVFQQESPFKTTDGSPALEDDTYTVDQADYWARMKRYGRFTVQPVTFDEGEFIYVNKDPSNETQPDAVIKEWIAKIVEIRGGDPTHVFIRVYWMYRPEDLAEGRQSYHAKEELIASNDMAIINAETVDGRADVKYLDEDVDQHIIEGGQLFWRQAVDTFHQGGPKLTDLRQYCVCKQPFNPHDKLIECESCGDWLHGQCLEAAAVQKAHKMRYIDNGVKNEEGEDDVAHITLHTPRYSAKLTVDADGTPRLALYENQGSVSSSDNALSEEIQHGNRRVDCLICGHHLNTDPDDEGVLTNVDPVSK